MKILNTDYFISERIKVQPITNAEFDAIKKEMYQNSSFRIDSITCGTIVMFRDKTLGVYMDGAIAYEISVFFGRNKNGKAFYLSIPNVTRTKSSALVDADDFTSNLKYRPNKEIDIIRIYNNAITQDEMKSLANDDFYSAIEKMAKDRTYIERQ